MSAKLSQLLANELLKIHTISPEQLGDLQLTAEREGKDLGEVVVEKGLMSDKDLALLKSALYQLPIVDGATIEAGKSAITEISEDVAKFYRVVPFGNDGKVLKIGLTNPEDINALEALKFIAADKGLGLEKYIITYKDFGKVVGTYQTLGGEVSKALESLGEEPTDEAKDAVKFEEITAESPVTTIVSSILKHAVESRASDIHIEPFDDRVRIRFRIDGALVTVLTLPKPLHSAVVTRIKILSDLKIDETRLAQDGRFSIKMSKTQKVDYRVSTFPTKNGEKVVMRILDPLSQNIDLPSLGFQGRSFELLEGAIARPYGIILITGPTGSGKSTTLAGILKRINREEVNIVTLEDPIEYYIDGVNQSQVHEEIGYTFASGLRHILRQDPDVIMVGEIRDSETASLAIQAALTGHIVLSTLHTNDALGIIPRLVDMGVERYLLPPTIAVAGAQRLLRRLCQTCKVEVSANAAEEKIISDGLASMPAAYRKDLPSGNYKIFKPNPEPCKECGGKAYKGRMAIVEMMEMTPKLEEIILGNLSEAGMREEAKRQGMITMFQDGLIKVLQGVVSLEELMEVAQSGEDSA